MSRKREPFGRKRERGNDNLPQRHRDTENNGMGESRSKSRAPLTPILFASASVSLCLCGEFLTDFAFSLFRAFAFSNSRKSRPRGLDELRVQGDLGAGEGFGDGAVGLGGPRLLVEGGGGDAGCLRLGP